MNIRMPRWPNLSLRLKILAVAGLPVLALLISSTTFLLLTAQQNKAEDAAKDSFAIREATDGVEAGFQAVNGAIWGDALGFGSTMGLDEANAKLDARVKTLRKLTAGDQKALGLLADFEAKLARQVAIVANTWARLQGRDASRSSLRRCCRMPRRSRTLRNTSWIRSQRMQRAP